MPEDRPDTGLRITGFGLLEADRWGEELEALLNGVGISISSGSDLERICLAPSEILAYKAGTGISSDETYRQFLDAAALAELAARVVEAREHPSFDTLLPHLDLLNHGDPRQAGRASQTDQAARKLFELFVALLSMRFSDGVQLEHPVHGSERNPDVLVDFEGRTWGVACKVPTSRNPESLVQNLVKAVDQVVRSGVEVGLPLFNVKNVISPDSYWQASPSDVTGRAFVLVPEPEDLPRRAIHDVNMLWRRVHEHVPPGVFETQLQRSPCVPVVLSYLHVLAPVVHDDIVAAMTSRFVACYHVGKHSRREEAFIHALHRSAIDRGPE